MKTDKVAARISALLEVSDRTQPQIAQELGYNRANIISMFKTGTTKVPINKLGPLAVALNADPGHMVRLGLETYYPETYAAIKEYLGPIISPHEEEILAVIRKASKESDPKLTPAIREGLQKLFAP
jgi:hypothetical protein